MKLIAIIPARTMSKRLPMKNYRDFFGRPIIQWVIDEISKSELFDKIIISSDKLNSIDTILENNNLVDITTFLRKNPQYEQTVDEVCLEVLQEYSDYDYMGIFYPTAYAITWQDLCKSFIEMKSVFRCVSTNMLNYSYKEAERIQIKHPFPHEGIDNGGFYWCRIKEFLEEKSLMGSFRINYDLPMVDINTMQDFTEAKLHALTLSCGRFK